MTPRSLCNKIWLHAFCLRHQLTVQTPLCHTYPATAPPWLASAQMLLWELICLLGGGDEKQALQIYLHRNDRVKRRSAAIQVPRGGLGSSCPIRLSQG